MGVMVTSNKTHFAVFTSIVYTDRIDHKFTLNLKWDEAKCDTIVQNFYPKIHKF